MFDSTEAGHDHAGVVVDRPAVGFGRARSERLIVEIAGRDQFRYGVVAGGVVTFLAVIELQGSFHLGALTDKSSRFGFDLTVSKRVTAVIDHEQN